MAYLTAQQILQVDDRDYEDVSCPEWGGVVRIRSLTGAEYDDFQESIMKGRGQNKDVRFRNMRVKLIQRCAVDGNGALLFSEDDINRLNKKNSKPIDRLFDACQKIIGMSDEDAEEMVKDFDVTPNGASSSD
jgi:hypothetical protein